MASTAKVKQKLNAHRKMVEEYDNLQQELDMAVEKYGGLQGIRYDVMPKGGSCAGNTRIENAVIRKMDIEELMARKSETIKSDWAEIESMVESLKQMEALIIRLRYNYAADWEEICRQLYGKKSDYAEEQGAYMNRVFKMHGRALFALAQIYN